MIAPARQEHAREIAELHHEYIRSLLRDLGRRMCVAFYEAALRSDANIVRVYLVQSRVVGFILGTPDNSRLFKTFRLRLELARALCTRPGAFRRLLLHLSPGKFPPGPEVAYMAVDPGFRGQGIGEQLVLALHEEFRRRRIAHYELSVDNDNLSTLSLYRKLGARVEGEFWEGRVRRLRLENTL